jgi:tRNA-specific 2-thiouridylase
MNIAALVSGGVDSSVVVHNLKEMGYDPTIFYIRIGMEDEDGYIDCPSEEDIEITTYIAKKYGCRFEIVSLHEEYWENVVSYTIESVRRGLTPNPDMMCNKLIKFGAFEQKWGKDFDKIATGHYATILSTSAVFGKTRFKAIPLNEPDNIMEASLLILKDAYQKTAAKEFIKILLETDAVKRRLMNMFE